MNNIDITTHYNGISKIYFEKVIDKIIEIGKLYEKNIKVLDFGCGEKILQKKLNKKIFNYDINPNYSDLSNWDIIKYFYFMLKLMLILCLN